MVRTDPLDMYFLGGETYLYFLGGVRPLRAMHKKQWFAVLSSCNPPDKITFCGVKWFRQPLTALILFTRISVLRPIQDFNPFLFNSCFTISITESGDRSWSQQLILLANNPHNWSILSWEWLFRRQRSPVSLILYLEIRLLRYPSTYEFFASRTVLSEKSRRVPGIG